MLLRLVHKFGVAVVLLALVYIAVLAGVWLGFEFAEWKHRDAKIEHQVRCKSSTGTERFTAHDEFNMPVCVEKSHATKQIRVVRLVYAEN
jgi:hypothetical protein